MGDELELAVGDAVVYAGHGVGVVVARESEHVVIECDRSLSVTFSLEHARVVLRPLPRRPDIRDVQAALRAEDSTLPGALAEARQGDSRQGHAAERSSSWPRSCGTPISAAVRSQAVEAEAVSRPTSASSR